MLVLTKTRWIQFGASPFLPEVKKRFQKILNLYWAFLIYFFLGVLGSEAANMDFLGYFDRIMHKTATAVTTSR